MRRLLVLFLILYSCSNLKALNINFLPEWKKEGRLSFSSESGNTDEENFAARIKLNKPKGDNRYYFDLQYYLERNDHNETKNEFIYDSRFEHSITKKVFYFYNGHYKRDKFAGIQTRIYAGPGLGYIFLDNEKHLLKLYNSINYDYENLDDGTDSYNASDNIKLLYEYHFNSKITLGEETSYSIAFNNSDRYFADSETSLEFSITEHIAIVFNFLIEYQNIIAHGDYKHTDRKFNTSLSFKF
jgi:putative salt-induced outer membrane protein YdiY